VALVDRGLRDLPPGSILHERLQGKPGTCLVDVVLVDDVPQAEEVLWSTPPDWRIAILYAESDAARTPIIVITVISSIRVKPDGGGARRASPGS